MRKENWGEGSFLYSTHDLNAFSPIQNRGALQSLVVKLSITKTLRKRVFSGQIYIFHSASHIKKCNEMRCHERKLSVCISVTIVMSCVCTMSSTSAAVSSRGRRASPRANLMHKHKHKHEDAKHESKCCRDSSESPKTLNTSGLHELLVL